MAFLKTSPLVEKYLRGEGKSMFIARLVLVFCERVERAGPTFGTLPTLG